jgi:hypothetical protein
MLSVNMKTQISEEVKSSTWMSSLNTRWVVLYFASNRNALWFAKSSNCIGCLSDKQRSEDESKSRTIPLCHVLMMHQMLSIPAVRAKMQIALL